MKYYLNFENLVSKSYAFNYSYFKNDSDWGLLENLYVRNYLCNYNTEQKIPKRIHQIWLGSQLPEKYLKYTETWKKFHPDWEYKLWTDADVNELKISKPNLFKDSLSFGTKSDILRYEILQKFGGLYVDTDFECLKPFDELLNLKFFIGISYDTRVQLYNGLIACIPNHPVITATLKNINDHGYTGKISSQIINSTGANHLTKYFLQYCKSDMDGTVAFPMQYFYPFPNNDRQCENPYKYIEDCSYAIHHWDVSWTNKKK